MIFEDLVGIKLPDIHLTGEEKPRKNLTQETCPDRGSNPGPLRDNRAYYHLFHSGGQYNLAFALTIEGNHEKTLSQVVRHHVLKSGPPKYEPSMLPLRHLSR